MFKSKFTTAGALLCVKLALIVMMVATVVVFRSLPMPVRASSNQMVTIGMPFTGQWAYNALVTPPYTTNNSSWPGVHPVDGGGDWATDIYKPAGTAVKLWLNNPTGTMTLSLRNTWTSSCAGAGSGITINVSINGVNIGWVSYAHLDNINSSGPFVNGMTLGVITYGSLSSCYSAHHTHLEVKNATPYSCWVDNGQPGRTLNEQAAVGVLGATNTGVKQSCTSQTTGNQLGTPPPPSPTILGTDHLNPGDQMSLNSEIDSTDGRFRFVFQADSNLVIYGPSKALWASNTGGQNASALIMQTDGNLVLYRSGGYPLWASGTRGTDSLWMQTDGNAVIYNQNGSAVWNSNSWYGSINATYYGSDTLSTNAGYGLNTYLRSAHWYYWLLLQSDGNLVLYTVGYAVLWKSNTGSPTNYLLMQTDGNLVLYAPVGVPEWSTHTGGANAALVMQDDGNAVVYSGGHALWSSNTSS